MQARATASLPWSRRAATYRSTGVSNLKTSKQ
jgi:hypothetical protein